MDLDGDGRRDAITGCWPGELYVFRGAEKGLEAASKLTFANGKEINLGNASTVFAADWEGDGDLDLLVGNIDGEVWRVPNTSGGKALRFEAAVAVRVGGKPLSASHDSAPVMADWDGDGRRDLVLGDGDGSVRWCRDLAREGEPLFGPARVLVTETPREDPPASAPKRAPRPGYRAKITVADWDEDGRLDLLIGDLHHGDPEPLVLDEAQRARREALAAEISERARRWSARFETALDELLREQGGTESRQALGKTASGRRRLEALNAKAYERLLSDPEFGTSFRKRQQSLSEELASLSPADELHGYVWLYAGAGGPASPPAASSPTR